MSEIVPFNFDGQSVRVIVDLEGNPWWVAGDVCNVLEIVNVGNALMRLDEADIRTADVWSVPNNRHYPQKIVNESGLYDLVFESRKPEARRFRRWVTSEVLPSIRRTGSYGATPAVPQTYAEALRAHADAVEARELAERKVAELEPAAEQFRRWQLSEDTVYVNQWAKMIGLTQPKAYQALRELGVMFKQRQNGGSGDAFNLPKRGWEQYFEITQEFLTGLRKWVPVCKITAEGQVVLTELLMENGWVSP